VGPGHQRHLVAEGVQEVGAAAIDEPDHLGGLRVRYPHDLPRQPPEQRRRPVGGGLVDRPDDLRQRVQFSERRAPRGPVGTARQPGVRAGPADPLQHQLSRRSDRDGGADDHQTVGRQPADQLLGDLGDAPQVRRAGFDVHRGRDADQHDLGQPPGPLGRHLEPPSDRPSQRRLDAPLAGAPRAALQQADHLRAFLDAEHSQAAVGEGDGDGDPTRPRPTTAMSATVEEAARDDRGAMAGPSYPKGKGEGRGEARPKTAAETVARLAAGGMYSLVEFDG